MRRFAADLVPFACLAGLLVGASVLAGCVGRTHRASAAEPDEARARAALALAQAQREREQAAAGKAANPCRTDWAQAFQDAREKRVPLVLWVGMVCADKPDLRNALGDVVHLHCDTNNGSKAPRVVIVDAVNRPGVAAGVIHQADLDRDSAARLLKAYQAVASAPPKGGLTTPPAGTVVGRARGRSGLADPEFGEPRDNLEALYLDSLRLLREGGPEVPDATRDDEATIRAELRAMRERGGGLGPWPDGKGPDLGPPAFEGLRPAVDRPQARPVAAPGYGPPVWAPAPVYSPAFSPGPACPPGGG